jgi:hypothetical protein
LLVGLLGGVVALAGLSCANAFLAHDLPWFGGAFTTSMAVAVAFGGARPASARAALATPLRDGWAAAACVGTALLAGTWFARGPQQQVPDIQLNFLLLDGLARHLAPAPHWRCGLDTTVVAIAIGVLGFVLLAAVERWRSWLVRVLVLLLCFGFLVCAPTLNPVQAGDVSRPLAPRTSLMDGFVIMRCHLLMQQGFGYYQAYWIAEEERSIPTDLRNLLSWRPPTVWYLWQPLPGATAVWGAFWIGAALTMALAWYLLCGWIDEAVALWAPLLMNAYLMYGAVTMWFAIQEYWATWLLVAGLAAWWRGWPIAGAALLGLAMVSREQYVLLLLPLLYVAARPMYRPLERVAALAVAVVVPLFYALHQRYVQAHYGPLSGSPGHWLVGNLSNLAGALRFGNLYVSHRFELWMPFLGAGVVGAILLLRFPRRGVAGLVLAWGALQSLLLLSVAGTESSYYWGVQVVPELIMCLPLVLLAVPAYRAAAQE